MIPSSTLIFPEGTAPAPIMIVGDFPAEREVAAKQPFAGWTKDELSRLLHAAGIAERSTFKTLAVRSRPPGNDPAMFFPEKRKDIDPAVHEPYGPRYVARRILPDLETLKREIFLCRPKVIIAMGNAAMYLLTGQWGIKAWRGSILELTLETGLDFTPKVIPTYPVRQLAMSYADRFIIAQDFRRAHRESTFPGRIPPDYRFHVRPSYDLVMDVLGNLLDNAETTKVYLSVDIETKLGHIDCIGLAWNSTDALCIPFMSRNNPQGYWHEEEELYIILALRKLLTHPNVRVIGQNFSYDSQYIYRWWFCLPNLYWDTMIRHHSIYSNSRKSLDFLASLYCDYYIYWKDENQEADDHIPEEQRWTYNCKDCVYTFEIATAQVDTIGKYSPSWPQLLEISNFQQQLASAVLPMMLRGIAVDRTSKSTLASDLTASLHEREAWISSILGHPLNLRSPKQMKEFFYGDLQQKPVISRKSGNPTCDDEALRKIASREPLLSRLVSCISDIRSIGVFYSTFVSAAEDVDGRMRCSFNITGTETYRFSSSQNAFGSGLNLQNIPSGGGLESGELPNIRKLFIPDPGHTFFDIDLSSADLRIVVWEADEPEMKAMLLAGLDPYTEIAKEFYHDPSISKKDPRRQIFKSFAHGTNYLGTAKGLAERLGLSVADAERTQAWYFSRFPRIKKWQEDLISQVKNRRYIENVFGYRCYFHDRIEGTIFNQAAAWIPQSTVACIINRGLVNIHTNLPEVQLLLQVHDSLAGQYATHLGDWAIRRILEECSIILPYDDPMVIPVGVKKSTKSWGDCE